MSTCNRLDLQTLGSQPIMSKISPITGPDHVIVRALDSHLVTVPLTRSVGNCNTTTSWRQA